MRSLTRRRNIMRVSRPMIPVLALAVVSALASSRPAPAGTIYLVLGDSYALGVTSVTPPPSYGDQGYVKHYADHLATLDGGVRPDVINLAIFGESSTTFFAPGPGFGR